MANANPHFSFSDKNSAVANYLNSVKELLDGAGYEITLFPHRSSGTTSPVQSRTRGLIRVAKKLLKTNLPFLYHSLVDYSNLLKTNRAHRKIIQNCSPDITLEFLSFFGMAGYLLKKNNNIPYILIYDAPLAEQYKEMSGAGSLLLDAIRQRETLSVQHADAIICYSNAVVNYLTHKYNIDKNRCTVLPTISHHRLTVKKRSATGFVITIGFIGSFLKYHKPEILIAVFEDLCKIFHNLKLCLIGYGECWHDIDAVVRKSPVKDKIFLPGFVSDSELEDFKQLFDIAVIPSSNWYGSPMKLFEYAALGIPVVAPATPTIKEIFKDKEEVLLFTDNNSRQMIFNYVRELIENDALRIQIGKNGFHALKKRYSETVYHATLHQTISSVLNQRIS